MMKCENPWTNRIAFFVEKCLPFGASVSCRRFQDFSNALQHIIEFNLNKKFSTTNYLDNFLFISSTEQDCNEMVRQFLNFCEEIGCPVVLDKTEWASLKITFLRTTFEWRFKDYLNSEKINAIKR